MSFNPPKLLGKYRTPRFSSGDVVACARRGDVRIVGLSSAPIPWPLGQRLPKGRKRSLVLDGALAKSVRRESAESVAFCWRLRMTTVWLCRKALGVEEFNEGTRRFKITKGACVAPQPGRTGTRAQKYSTHKSFTR
jgi:hypothetical protein